MTKVVKKHVKKAIIIYEDPDLKEGRRVVLGEPLELMKLMMEQFPILWSRLQKMLGKDLNPVEMLEFYKEIKEEWATTHGAKFAKDMEMTLNYEVKKLK